MCVLFTAWSVGGDFNHNSFAVCAVWYQGADLPVVPPQDLVDEVVKATAVAPIVHEQLAFTLTGIRDKQGRTQPRVV